MQSNNYSHLKRLFTYRKGKIMVFVFILFFFPWAAIAQPVPVPPLNGDADIRITAFVSGCGDGILQTSIGEQCEGVDLNSQSCQSIGFDSGTLSCRPSCIFDTANCQNNSESSSGGSRQNTNNVSIQGISGALIFTGSARPGDTIVVLNNGDFFASGIADSDGRFTVEVLDFESDLYDFTFYSISSEFGNSSEKQFSLFVQENSVMEIQNIDLSYELEASTNTPTLLANSVVNTLISPIIKPLFDVILSIQNQEEVSTDNWITWMPYILVLLVGSVFFGALHWLFWGRKKGGNYIDYYDKTKK